MKDRIEIQVKRNDGNVTMLRGNSGIATCMGPLSEEFKKSDPPVVSLRCDTEAELAWNLAAVLGAVRHHSPAAFELAHELMEYCNFEKPLVNNRITPL